jgi:FkbH-like protein
MSAPVVASPAPKKVTVVKCLVWDLDNTVWDGVLLEGGAGQVLPGVRETLIELDRRGILNSVASKNEPELAMARLSELGLAEYFLHPQIGWGPKSAAVQRVAEVLNIGIDALAFVDDQAFERDEVNFVHPSVLCLDATLVPLLGERAEFTPPFITDESAHRREMYRSATDREQAEQSFEGNNTEFLAQLEMKFTISPARVENLRRAEELTVRTHQLNSTGRTFGYEELEELIRSPDHLLLVAELDDRYGSYGTIGLVLVELGAEAWQIKLLLMSCRVMSRGVGTVLLQHLQARAAKAGVVLQADFVPTDRNRIMYVTYRFAGFTDALSAPDGDGDLLEYRSEEVPEPPDYLQLVVLG